MFKIIPNPSFTCAVNLSVPGDMRPASINFTFRHKTARELAAWLGSAGSFASDADFLDEVIESWAGVLGANDEVVAYSKAALAELCNAFPAAGKEICQAYTRQLTDARAKN